MLFMLLWLATIQHPNFNLHRSIVQLQTIPVHAGSRYLDL